MAFGENWTGVRVLDFPRPEVVEGSKERLTEDRALKQ